MKYAIALLTPLMIYLASCAPDPNFRGDSGTTGTGQHTPPQISKTPRILKHQ